MAPRSARPAARMLLTVAIAAAAVGSQLPGAASQSGGGPAKIKPLGSSGRAAVGPDDPPRAAAPAPAPPGAGSADDTAPEQQRQQRLQRQQLRGGATYANDYSAVGRFFIQGDTGNVGIGDAFSSRRPPSRKLEVHGDVYVAGGLHVGAPQVDGASADRAEARMLIDDRGSVLFNLGRGGAFEVREAAAGPGDGGAAPPPARVSLLNGHYLMMRKASELHEADAEGAFAQPVYIDVTDGAAIDCTVFLTATPLDRGGGDGAGPPRASMHRVEFFASLSGTDLFHQTVSRASSQRGRGAPAAFELEYDINYFNTAGAAAEGDGASPAGRSLRLVVRLRLRPAPPPRGGAAPAGVSLSSVTTCRGDGMTGTIS